MLVVMGCVRLLEELFLEVSIFLSPMMVVSIERVY